MLTNYKAKGDEKLCFATVIYILTFFLGWVVFWELFHCFVTSNCNILWSQCVTERMLCCVSAVACLTQC